MHDQQGTREGLTVEYGAAAYDLQYEWRREKGWPGWFQETDLLGILTRLDARLQVAGLTGGRVLEVGCGAGDQALHLAGKGFTVTGVDVSPKAIDWAQHKAECTDLNVAFAVGDACDLPSLKLGHFDLVLDGNCLHFIFADRRDSFLAGVARVLRPDGMFLVSSVCNDPETQLADEFDIETRIQYSSGLPVTYFGKQEQLVLELQRYFSIERLNVAPGQPGLSCDMLYADLRKIAPGVI